MKKIYHLTNRQCGDKGKQNDHGKQTEQKKKHNEKEKKIEYESEEKTERIHVCASMSSDQWYPLISAEKKEGINRGWLTSYTAIDNTLSKYIYLILPKNSPGGF